jgi:glycosyltransferase involved in cell wall biosynthesis
MISICIPAYEMDGEGAKFITQSLEAIQAQSFQDYETVVSDHSIDDKVEQACARFPKVSYLRNARKRGSASANLNHAINHAKGDYIKVLFQDDFLAGPDSLARMRDGIGDKAWLVHSYWHTDFSGVPRFDPTDPFVPDQHRALVRHNTIGAPSAVMFKKCGMRFDENLRWFMDSEFYYRLLRAVGLPAILREPLVVQTLWPGQVTNKLRQRVKDWEYYYVLLTISRHFLMRPPK